MQEKQTHHMNNTLVICNKVNKSYCNRREESIKVVNGEEIISQASCSELANIFTEYPRQQVFPIVSKESPNLGKKYT